MVGKDVIIGQLMRQNTELQQHVCELESIVKQQQNVIAELQDKIARLSKNSSNSSKPPSSDIIGSNPKLKSKRKRKRGGQKGHQRHDEQVGRGSEPGLSQPVAPRK